MCSNSITEPITSGLRSIPCCALSVPGRPILAVLLLLLLSQVLSAAVERGFVPLRREAGDHIALVIGNAAYSDVPLANPVNDAVDIGKAIASIGFQVTVVSDADKSQMLEAIGSFGDKLAKAKVAMFYYAGHGVQSAGTNWLIPVARRLGETISREDEVRLRAVDANEVLIAMERSKVPVAMVVLDACRNNPFKATGRSSMQGLAQLDAPSGSLVVYATAPGRIAADGMGRNSPFSQAFLGQVLAPGQDIDAMLRNIKREVRKATGGDQVPWSASSMTEAFAFVPVVAPEEERAMKLSQLRDLQSQDMAISRFEGVAASRRQLESASLQAKQAEIERLNEQIAALKAKRSGPLATTANLIVDGDIDRILMVVQQQEAQQLKLAAMRTRTEQERTVRATELAALRQQEYQFTQARQRERLQQLGTDVAKYRVIADSDFGRDLAQSAWDQVLKKWGLSPGSVARDEVQVLAAKVAPDGDPLVPSARDNARPRWMVNAGADAMGTWSTLQVGGISQRFRWIPPGDFTMGCDQAEATWAFDTAARPLRELSPQPGWFSDAVPAHRVSLSRGFWMADTLCTQALWQVVMGSNPSRYTGNDNLPVEQVSWEDCQEFFIRLNTLVSGLHATFPSEAQWEYACRAGSTTRWSWGDDASVHALYVGMAQQTLHDSSENWDIVAWAAPGTEGTVTTDPVAQRAPNGWGLYDMHGKVFQWCSDWYGPYNSSAVRDPAGPPSGPSRVHRGGTWYRTVADCRPAYRGQTRPGFRWFNLGIRICIPSSGVFTSTR